MSPLVRIILKIGNLYNRYLCLKEYRAQRYVYFNERPAEYSFLFRHLTSLCPHSVLDIGTGTTALPHLMSHCGFVVTSIDNVRDFWPRGMFNRHFYVIDDDICAPRLRLKFDLITCISVLEHIKDPDSAVTSMFSMLNPDGHVILSFPYSETTYVENVYVLDGSSAPKDVSFITQAFSRKELNRWIAKNDGQIVDQEFWQYFTGPFWTLGKRLKVPKQVAKDDTHQMSCLLIAKR